MRAIPTEHLTPGMLIHHGQKTTFVKRVERGESCNGIHVNDADCYDRAGTVVVSGPLTAADMRG
jgi:hypothetical protein